MASGRKEKIDLVGQHDAIRAQMEFLVESLKGLDVPPESGQQGLQQIKKTIQGYSYTLRDLRTGVINHIELDEGIFKSILSGSVEKQLMNEHKKIMQQIDLAIQLVDQAIEKQTATKLLSQQASEISKVIDTIQKLIRSHTAEEDKLLKSS